MTGSRTGTVRTGSRTATARADSTTATVWTGYNRYR